MQEGGGYANYNYWNSIKTAYEKSTLNAVLRKLNWTCVNPVPIQGAQSLEEAAALVYGMTQVGVAAENKVFMWNSEAAEGSLCGQYDDGNQGLYAK